MPNIGNLLKEEITRVARKQIRAEVAPLKAASIQSRKTISDLKAQVASLERELKGIRRKSPAAAVEPETSEEALPARFSAKGLKSQRARLGLSAGDFGRLVGVTAQSVYNWEQESARPRAEQLARIVALRKMGKRQVTQILQELDGTQTAA
ncbi:MAG: hypothetical protein GC151_18445 [Betaproteobacteria bacterium]|nr:hypothetical protein [Betaproteobacteria bacterium]